MSKTFVRAMLVLIACFLSVSVIVAQGPRVTNITVVQQQPGSCATFAYFDLAGFTPNSEIFVESLSYREISCQNGAINDASWPRMSAGSSNGSGSLPYVTPIGGVSGTYTFAFSDSVSQITVTIQTNAQGQLIGRSEGSSNQVPAQTQPTPVPNVPQQGDQGKYPQGHEGVVWGGIHFGKYCGAQGFAEYNNGVNGSSWGCNGQSWNLDQVCRDIYGDALPYVSYKGTGLGDVFCSATSSNGGQPPVQQPDPMPSVSDKWCAVQRFDTDPATDRFLKGTEVHLFGRGGDCHPGNNGLPRATRYSIDGVLFGEKQMSENSDVFKTSGYSIGKHIVCFMVAADSDTTWEHRDEQCRTYTIYGQGDQPSPDGNNNTVPTSKDCPGVLPSLVVPGTIAIVNTVSNSNINVRSNAHISRDNILYKLAPLSLFSIVSGPICADGYRWWEIGYNGNSGYAAEADGDGYMYVPNGTALPYDPTGSVPSQPQVPVNPVDPPVQPKDVPTTGGWVLLKTDTAPFSNLYCVSPGLRYSSGVKSLHDFYYLGYYYENVGCNAKDGTMLLDLTAWGGWDSSRFDSAPGQKFGNYVELQGVYTPDFTGTVSIEIDLELSGYEFVSATPLKEYLRIPSLLEMVSQSLVKAKGAILGIPKIFSTLIDVGEIADYTNKFIDGSRGLVAGHYYLIASDSTKQLGVDFHQLTNTAQIDATYPSQTPNVIISANGQTITLYVVIPVQNGVPVKVTVGQKAEGSSYGTALVGWIQDKPVQIKAIRLLKLQ